MHKYRIRLRFFGFEPQMLCIAGRTGKSFWTPLARTGYWAEPDSYSEGTVTGKYPMTLRDARLAIARAKSINEHGKIVRRAA